MTTPEKKDPIDRLTDAYEQMLGRVHQAMTETREYALPGLREYLADVREKMVEIGELTREEADEIATYIERDIKDTASYLSETGDELSQWWRFDVQLVENRLLEMFMNVADQTKLELERFAEQAGTSTRYHTGELTGPGTLVCRECGREMPFHKTDRIPACPHCQGTEFQRARYTAEED